MSRVLGLLLVGWITVSLTGCVGPMGAGCCGTSIGPGWGGSCDAGCSDSSCGSCNSCTGCGELYVDPWINHPADCTDPCDACGNYNGQSCGKCRSVFAGVRTLWGYRCGCDPGPISTTRRGFAPACASGCDGCDSCGIEPACGCEGVCDCAVMEPGCGFEPACGIEPGCGFEPACGCEGPCSCEPACGCEGGCNCGGGMTESYGPPAGEIIIESPGQAAYPVHEQPYAPQRTRKIFNPRTETASRGGFLNEYRR
ncbi:hypothetical protein [Stieleria sp.]|uniref:hypothetical protein n=1 Tax=Stieleria sp. TaxID=2795976 RepID=UPI0035650D2D